MAIVYKHINPNTKETFYIGIGKSKKRAYSKHSRNKYWKNYTKKYGFEVEILKENISWNEACKLEIELIKKFGRKDLGKGKLLNMTDGGEGLVNISQVTRNKMSLSKIGKTPWNKGRKLKPYGKMCISTKKQN